MENIIITGNTYQTTDYSLFHIINSNREVDAKRVNKILKSITENGYIFNPVLVDEWFNILDGQGRFAACKILGLPIDYIIVKNADPSACAVLNSVNTQWTLMDFIKSHAANNNPDYILLLKLIEDYNYLNSTLVLKMATAKVSLPSKDIKSGELAYTLDMDTAARRSLLLCTELKPALDNIAGSKHYYYCAAAFAEIAGVDRDRLIKVINTSRLVGVNNIKEALDALTDVYNHGLKDMNRRVYLYPLYQKSMAEKYGWYALKWGSDETEEK